MLVERKGAVISENVAAFRVDSEKHLLLDENSAKGVSCDVNAQVDEWRPVAC